MNNPLKKAAEILVECGYADYIGTWRGANRDDNTDTDEWHRLEWHFRGKGKDMHVHKSPEIVNPFADTIEGIHQAHAIEDYLYKNKHDLWTHLSSGKSSPASQHQWRLNKIRWCLEELGEADE